MYVKVATSRCSVVWEYLNSYQLIGKKTNQELFQRYITEDNDQDWIVTNYNLMRMDK
uniref:Uncharacterized protein n=1 Tax=Magallana gigas TaxID=29159 RepID=K1Q7I7_MAGGI